MSCCCHQSTTTVKNFLHLLRITSNAGVWLHAGWWFSVSRTLWRAWMAERIKDVMAIKNQYMTNCYQSKFFQCLKMHKGAEDLLCALMGFSWKQKKTSKILLLYLTLGTCLLQLRNLKWKIICNIPDSPKSSSKQWHCSRWEMETTRST